MLEKKYIQILDKIVKYFKDYEHEKLKEISGTEIDKLLKDTEDYLKRLKELREQIEKRVQEKTIDEIHKEVFNLLELIFGKKNHEGLIREFEDSLIKTGKLTQNSLKTLKEIANTKKDFKKKKTTSHKIDEVRKNATILINELIDYSQRRDLLEIEKTRLRLKYHEKNQPRVAELIVCDGKSFLIRENQIMKITDKIEKSNTEELSNSVQEKKNKQNVEIKPKTFEILKNEIGDFEIVF
jgi:hypothetical protein